MAQKRSIEKQLLLTGTLNTLLLADSSTASITYKLVMLLIKRKKFLVKLSESILFETDVCFKRNKCKREIWVSWSEHSRKWEIYFVFYITEHLRHMACSVIGINICSQDLQEIIIYKTIKKTFTAISKEYFKWDYYHFSFFHVQTCTTNMRRATDLKSTPLWISYHFSTCKHSDKLDQKAVWLFSVSYRSIFISGFMWRPPNCFETNVRISWFEILFQWKLFPCGNQSILI